MTAYYNDVDPYVAAWLRNLIAAGLIPEGDVDERSITEVTADDVRGYRQCHFFAGLGGWALALRLAGWPDDRPIWTGSCPCQPFSAAGKRAGHADERHLWPAWLRLIGECRPPVVMGEQVAGAIGHGWLDGVCADLEAEGYACGAAVLGAHSVGAPHIRSRLYWVADSKLSGLERASRKVVQGRGQGSPGSSNGSDRLADSLGPRLEGRQGERSDDGAERAAAERGGDGGGYGLENSEHARSSCPRTEGGCETTANDADRRGAGDLGLDYPWSIGTDEPEFQAEPGSNRENHGIPRQTSVSGWWFSYALVGPDPQGKYRRVGARLCGLVDGRAAASDGLCTDGYLPLLTRGEENRVNKLRALGNGLCIPLAAEVVRAYMEAR